MTRVLVLAALCAAAIACGLAPVATAAGGGYGSGPLLGLEAQFMCVSCHEPLELVSSPQAQSEKAYLGSLLKQGKTTAEIKTIMVAQYGPAVLARPPASGFNLVLYVLPPALGLTALALLAYTVPKWRRRAQAAAETPLSGSAPLPSDQSERLDQELSRLV